MILNFAAIKQIPDQQFWLVVGSFGLFVFIFFYQSYRCILKSRAIADIPSSKIRSAAQGLVEIEGIQHFHKQPIMAGLTQLPCTWYRFVVHQQQQKKWVPINRQESLALFELHDKTGFCVIDPKGAEIHAPCMDTWHGFNRLPKGKPKTWFGRLWGHMGHYYYQEWRMEDGMPLYAMGNFHTENGVNTLNADGTTKNRPFLLSVTQQSRLLLQYKWAAFGWMVAYLLILSGIGALLAIRFV